MYMTMIYSQMKGIYAVQAVEPALLPRPPTPVFRITGLHHSFIQQSLVRLFIQDPVSWIAGSSYNLVHYSFTLLLTP